MDFAHICISDGSIENEIKMLKSRLIAEWSPTKVICERIWCYSTRKKYLNQLFSYKVSILQQKCAARKIIFAYRRHLFQRYELLTMLEQNDEELMLAILHKFLQFELNFRLEHRKDEPKTNLQSSILVPSEYTIQNSSSKLFLGSGNDSNYFGAKISQWKECNNDACQWELIYCRDISLVKQSEVYVLNNMLSQRLLSSKHRQCPGGSVYLSIDLAGTIKDGGPQDWEQWSVEDDGSGLFTIKNLHSGFYLGCNGNSSNFQSVEESNEGDCPKSKWFVTKKQTAKFLRV